MGKITIITLNNDKFNKLPYKYAKRSVGLAIPKEGKAYIRITNNYLENRDTIHHELSELINAESAHEYDGVRYKQKWYSSFTRPFHKASDPSEGVPGVLSTGGKGGLIGSGIALALAPFTAGASLAYLPLAGALGGAAQEGIRMTQGKAGVMDVVGGGLTGFGIGSGAQWGTSALGMTGPTGMTAAGTTGKSFTTTITDPITGATKIVPVQPGAMGGGFNPSVVRAMGGAGAVTGGAVPFLGGVKTPSPASGALASAMTKNPATGAWEIMKEKLTNPMSLLGLGSMALSAMPTGIKPPEIGSTVSKWLTADTVTKAGAKAKEIADVEYTGEFQPSKEITAFIELQGKDIDKAYDKRIEQMDSQNLSINENWKRSGERLEMIRRVNEERQREKDLIQSEWLLTARKEYDTQKYNYVMNALQVDENTKRDLLYGDISDIMWKYNVAQEDVLNLRKIAADAGLYLLSQGMASTAPAAGAQIRFNDLGRAIFGGTNFVQ